MKKFSTLVSESYSQEITGKVGNRYEAAKKDILEKIEKTNGSGDEGKLKEVLQAIAQTGPDAHPIIGLTNKNELYDFYLKFQTAVDEALGAVSFFAKVPSDLQVSSMYDYVQLGVTNAIKVIAADLAKDLFGGE